MAESRPELVECEPDVVANQPFTSAKKDELAMAGDKPMAAEYNPVMGYDKPPPYSPYDINNPTLAGVNVTFNNNELPSVAYISTSSNTQPSHTGAKRKCSRARWIFSSLVILFLLILCGVVVYIIVANYSWDKPTTIPTTTRTNPTWPTATRWPTTSNKPWHVTTDQTPTVTTELVTRTSDNDTDHGTTAKTSPDPHITTTTDTSRPTLSPDVLEGECPEYGFPCLQGQCVRGDRYCDGSSECPDGSDEEDFCQDLDDIECGVQTINPYSQNGDDVISARSGSWPWQASLHRQHFGHHCSAVLIDDDYVVTAAHCVSGYDQQNFKVVLGINEHGTHMDDQQKQESQIEKFWIRENYDIALIKLKTEAEENDYVYPACLPREDQVLVNGQGSYVTYWFISKTTGSQSHGCDKQLKQSYVNIVSGDMCSYGNTDSTLCVEYSDTATLHSQHCKADTGGPLVSWYGGSWKATGIATHDVNCTHTACLRNFEDIAKHASWIEKIIDEDD